MDDRGVDGTPYQTALRLYAIADERWPEIEAAYYEVDLLRFPPAKFLNCVYTWCIARIDPEKREQWDIQLAEPLPGREKDKPSEATIEAEGAGFMALMATEAARKGPANG